jgi:predicted amidohydrolase YtcJ
VTETELVFTLSAFRSAGTISGDRIEHASLVPPTLIEQLRELELGVVTQPNFILERGDSYLRDIPVAEHPFLYRCRSLIDAHIPVAFGTDLPFGDPDPWVSLNAATNRQTASGDCLGESECISPDIALKGYLGDLSHPFESRSIKAGEPADCCLLDAPWEVLKDDLRSSHVVLTTRDGKVIYSRN